MVVGNWRRETDGGGGAERSLLSEYPKETSLRSRRVCCVSLKGREVRRKGREVRLKVSAVGDSSDFTDGTFYFSGVKPFCNTAERGHKREINIHRRELIDVVGKSQAENRRLKEMNLYVSVGLCRGGGPKECSYEDNIVLRGAFARRGARSLTGKFELQCSPHSSQ